MRRHFGVSTLMDSAELRARAQKVLPGGVNSPVRAFRAVGGLAPFIERAEGSHVFDNDGVRYIDYCGSWGPMILGHARKEVVEAVRKAAESGLSFGASTSAEVELAEMLCEIYPSIEMLRCVSSGTEATMSAIRVARGFTGRPVIVKFNGGYHGHSDCLLVQAGSGAATFGVPDSAGVPEEIVRNTMTASYNDLAGLRDVFEREGAKIAGVIVEPIAGNMGCVPPEPGFLKGIIDLCKEYGAISIFDEVMTGCRLSKAGAQGKYDLMPDLTCLGKIVGGGLPLAVYGGRRDIMEKVSPLGPVYQAGTLSGNPLSVAAARATLSLLDDRTYERLEELGSALEKGLRAAIAEAKVPACVQRVGSMITLFFREGPVKCWDDAKKSDTDAFARFHQGLMERGIYWPPAQFEAAFLSIAHSDEDIHATVNAARESLRAL
jgi:glutamate-1-semialdehyde 2,1-aminomutase